jgi:hypothetical protein
VVPATSVHYIITTWLRFQDIDKMPPKVVLPTTTLSGVTALRSGNDTSMGDTDSQLVTMEQLQDTIDQMNNNGAALVAKLDDIGKAKVKMLSIKRFDGTKSRLKGFLT